MTLVSTPGGRLAVEHLGDPDASSVVVFLHGLTANRSTWRMVASHVTGPHRLLLIDLLSRGQSDGAPGADFDLESEAGRLCAALRALDVRRPVLAGHSHGAAVAVAAAANSGARGLLLANPVTPDVPRPVLLAALRLPALRMILGPFLRLFRTRLTRYMLVRRVFTGEAGLPPGAVGRYAGPWEDADRARSLPSILAGWKPAELGRQSCPEEIPVRVLAGGRDRRIEPETARHWAEHLGAAFELLPACGHAVPEEEPHTTAEALRVLLETVHAWQEKDNQA